MVKSRPSMLKVLKKTRALLFFLFLFVVSFQRVSAVEQPNCSEVLVISEGSLGPSETTINYTVNPSGLRDDNSFQVQYSGDNSQSDLFDDSWPSFTGSFTIDPQQVEDEPQTIYLVNSEVHYCVVTLIYDEQQDRILIGNPGLGNPPASFDLCRQAGTDRSDCDTCLGRGEIWTGVGCIPFTAQDQTVRAFIILGLGVTGVSVVLMTLYASFLLSTSQGDPKRVDEAKSAISSAIVGAFFIIFSVTILRFIGVELLRIPAFG